MRNAYSILVLKPRGKRPFVRTRCRWEDNIRMDYRKIVWEDVEGSTGSQWGPVVSPSEYGNEPSDCIKCREFLDCLSD
jgi:hypothetical protein